MIFNMRNWMRLVCLLLVIILVSCKASKTISKAVSVKTETKMENRVNEDSVKEVRARFQMLQNNKIVFSTFNAKIKVESSGSNGKNPDITAVVRIIKDSAIWMSLSATILNVEIYRVLITKDSVVFINKQDKEVKFRSLDFIQEVTQIPFDFKTLQDFIIGNPIFVSDSIHSFKKNNDLAFFSTIDAYFKNLLTVTNSDNLLIRSKMDDIDVNRSRTADIIYDGYENNSGIHFSTQREVNVSEKNKLEFKLGFKQYEFNKELSVTLNVPKNYKRK